MDAANTNNQAKLFLHRMMIYTGALIMGRLKGKQVDDHSHQHLVNSPYPLHSLAALVHMCKYPAYFGSQDGPEEISAEFAKQRKEANRVAKELEQYVKAKVNQGEEWLCLQERFSDAMNIDGIRRRIEEERLGKREVRICEDNVVLFDLACLSQGEAMECNQKVPCISSRTGGLVDRVKELGVAMRQRD